MSVRYRQIFFSVSLACILLFSPAPGTSASPAHADIPRAIQPGNPAITQETAPESSGAFTGLPVYFAQNRGQYDPRVRFYVHCGNQTVFLTDSSLVFDSFFCRNEPHSATGSESEKSRPVKRLIWKLAFPDCNPRPHMEGISRFSGYFNYLKGNDSTKWHTNIPLYEGVLYHDLYPGIDLKVYFRKNQLEYDLVVRPGASPADIRIVCRGIDTLSVRNGELTGSTALCDIRQTRPVIYQTAGETEKQKNVSGAFKILSPDTYGFSVGTYDRTRPLVIDPKVLTLPFSSFLGGSGDDTCSGIKYHNNLIYVTGYCNSADFPVTTGTFDASIGGNNDVFVAKINPDAASAGDALIYCTFIGGADNDDAYDIDLLGDEPVICGSTSSDDFPLVRFDPGTTGGSSDAFVSHLNSAGTQLKHSMIIAASNTLSDEAAYGLSVNNSGCIWVTGEIPHPNNFYAHVGTRIIHSSSNPIVALGDIFVTQVIMNDNVDCSLGLIVILSGSIMDIPLAIASDNSNVWVAGYTNSDDLPVTPGAYQNSIDGAFDGWVAKIDYAGTLNYCTYLGGAGTDVIMDIALGANGIYACGKASANSFPITANAWQKYASINQTHAFMSKLNNSGSELLYSTFICPSDSSESSVAYAISVTDRFKSHCWVTGTTEGDFSLNTYSSKGYYQKYQGNTDGFLVRLDTDRSGSDSLIYATCLGGANSSEYAYDIAGSFNRVVVAGSTGSTDFPTSANAAQSSYSGGTADGFISQIIEPLPGVTTNPATAIYSYSARLNGTLDSLSGAPDLLVRFEISSSSSGPWSQFSESSMSAVGDFSYDVTGLSPGQTYYFRALAYSPLYDSVYGSVQSFATKTLAPPIITTAAVSNISTLSANSGGTISSMGSGPVTKRGVCFNTSGTPTLSDNHTSDGSGSGSFISTINVTAGGTYYVRAYATNEAGTAFGSEVSFTTVPLAPTAVAASSITAAGFTANWNTTACADSYRLDVATDSTFTSLVSGFNNHSAGNNTSITLSGLSPGTTYYYRVRAVNASGTSANSNSVSVLTVSAAPVATAATAVSASGFTANWNTAAGAAEYAIDVATDSAFTSFVSGYNSHSAGNNTSIILAGLNPATTYYYRIRAVNASGTSANSNTISVLTVSEAPVATAATAIYTSGFTANWNAAAGASAYAIDVATDSSFTSFVPGYNSHAAGNVTTIALSGMNPGTTYFYRVRAVNASGTSANSNTISVLTFSEAPVATPATAVSASGFTANWNTVAGATEYAIDVATDSAFTSFVSGYNSQSAGNNTSITLSGLSSGTTYYYRVRGVNANGNSPDSNTISVLTVSAAPVAAAATSVSASGFTANWNTVAGAAEYAIDVATDSAFTSFVPGYNSHAAGNVTAIALSGMNPGTTYYYRIRAVNGSGTSADSNTISVLTVSAAPVAAAAAAISASGFTANWNAVAGAAEYAIDVATDSAFTSFVPGYNSHAAGNVTAIALSGMNPGTTYYYRIRAVNAGGTSANSNTISVLTCPPAPVALPATGQTSNRFTANWQSLSNVLGYRIDVANDPAFTSLLPGFANMDAGLTTQYTVTGLQAEHTYFYRIRAYNNSGAGETSNTIETATLTVYTVSFSCTGGGHLQGRLKQNIECGCNCTPVEAIPDPGFRFIDWTGNNDFWSVENPLKVTDVGHFMKITASFTNSAPLVKIIHPADKATCWGTVQIKAEARDDSDINRVDFKIDGNSPPQASRQKEIGFAPRKPAANLRFNFGELEIDLENANILYINSLNRLRKIDINGCAAKVISDDRKVTDMALDNQQKLHLIFEESPAPDTQADCRWVIIDPAASTLSCRHQLPDSALQFDQNNRAYYFARRNSSDLALFRLETDTPESLLSLNNHQIQTWIVLPNGEILLKSADLNTGCIFFHYLDQKQHCHHLCEKQWLTLFARHVAGDSPAASEFIWRSDLYPASGNIISRTDDQVLSFNFHTKIRHTFSLNGIRSQCVASISDTAVLIAGFNIRSRKPGIWLLSRDAVTHMADINESFVRILPGPGWISLPDIENQPQDSLKNPPPQTITSRNAVDYSCFWNTLEYANGNHQIKVLATDRAGIQGQDAIFVRVGNITVDLSVYAAEDHSWIIRKPYVKIRLTVDNSSQAPAAVYRVYRSVSGTEEIIREIVPAELKNSALEFNDMNCPLGCEVSYRCEALTYSGMIIGKSVPSVLQR